MIFIFFFVILFRENLILKEGLIGFLLCVYLYFCDEEFWCFGEIFFLCFIKYLKYLIKDEVEYDKFNKMKLFFFIFFFCEWFLWKEGFYIFLIKSESFCK